MAMKRAAKEASVEQLKGKFSNTEIVILTRNDGLNAKLTNDLRVQSRAAGIDYKIAKNSLAKIAIKGTPYEGLATQMKGPIAFITGSDPIQTAKVIAEFAKKNPKLVLVGGVFEGTMMDPAAVEAFSKLPTMDEIRSKLVGLLQAPASQLVGVTKAYGEKEGGADDAAAPAAEPATAE